MSRRRKAIWLGSILLVLAGGIGGYYWHWQSHAIDRKVCQLVYEAAGYPDTQTEKFFKKLKLNFLLHEKPKSRDLEIVRKEIMAICTDATPGLASLLDEEDDNVRREAVFYLHKFGDARAVNALIEALQTDKSCEIRFQVAQTLGRLGDKRAVGPLIQALQNDSDIFVRDNAAFSLGRIGDVTAVEPLIQSLQNKQNIRSSIAAALGLLRDRRAVEPLCQLLNEKGNKENYMDRILSITALGKIGDKRAVEPLILAYQTDENAWIRWEAAESLGKLGDTKAVEPLIKGLLKDMELWKNPEYLPQEGEIMIKKYSAIALGEIGEPKAIEPLELAKQNNLISNEVFEKAMAKLRK
ncbi:MAG: HEAT repeat domain-containing protein [Planctomycetes bacterium]|nr:HEAT repeat domain-containing protein [Planctomycetota bacterium]